MKKLHIKVKPNSRNSQLIKQEDGWLADLKSSPVDGKANKELIGLVAELFKCPKKAVSIQAGAKARFKVIIIDAPAAEERFD